MGRVVVSMNGIVYEERVGMLLLCSTGLTDVYMYLDDLR